jgi:Tfp pilus assembly protein PilF
MQAINVLEEEQESTSKAVNDNNPAAFASILVNRALVYMELEQMEAAERDLRSALLLSSTYAFYCVKCCESCLL